MAKTTKTNDKDKHPGGRPTKYQKDYANQALKLTILGAIDKDLADFFEVNVDTIYEWKKKYPEFSESIKKGKDEADANVATSLYKKAIGYKHQDSKIFLHDGKPVIVPTEKHYPPDATAAIFWLKNRQPELWRDTKVIQGDKNNPLEVTWNEEKTYEANDKTDPSS